MRLAFISSYPPYIPSAAEKQAMKLPDRSRHGSNPLTSAVCLLTALLLPTVTWAHNGSTAYALPLEGITIDGDLSDWPDDLQVYPVREITSTKALIRTDLTATELDTSADFSPEFMVGYSLAEQFIYVALRVRDDETQVGGGFGLTDACEIYLDAVHGGVPYQYIISPEGGSYFQDGANPTVIRGWYWQQDIGATRSHGAVARLGNVTVYEWALELSGGSLEDPLELAVDTILGFDVVAVDKDTDEDAAAWVAWGRGPGKVSSDRMGDLTLIREIGDLGTARGTVVDPEGNPYSGFLVQATAAGGPAGAARTDVAGRFAMRLLVGNYIFKPARGEGVADFAIEAEVSDGRETSIDLSGHWRDLRRCG